MQARRAELGLDAPRRRRLNRLEEAGVARAPLVVSYGVGVDSTAMLVGMAARGIRPDLILFSDTGVEKPETYAYLPTMQAWLASVGFPAVVTVRLGTVQGDHGDYSTLLENCLVNRTLPSLAFGKKGCSKKWKVGPMDRYVKRWPPAIRAWANGFKVIRAIGYDAGPKDSKRAWKLTDTKRYSYRYYLRDWGWDRERCEAEIAAAGLPVPPKSACYICPATKPHELAELDRLHPELGDDIMRMEALAAPGLTKIEGNWRHTVKGFRGATPHPGAMTPFIQEERRKRRLPLLREVA